MNNQSLFEGAEKCVTKTLKFTHELSDTLDQSQAGMMENKRSSETGDFSHLEQMLSQLREQGLLPPERTKFWSNKEYCEQVAYLCNLYIEDKTLLIDPVIVQMLTKNYPFVHYYMEYLEREGRCTITDYYFVTGMVTTYLREYEKWANRKNKGLKGKNRIAEKPHMSCLTMKKKIKDRGMELRCHACPNQRKS